MRSRKIEEILNSLMTNNNELGRPIISGYNYFPPGGGQVKPKVIILSNIHYCDSYFQDVLRDISQVSTKKHIRTWNRRDKFGYFRWEKGFELRDDNGIIEPGLTIFNYLTNECLNIDNYTTATLNEKIEQEQLGNALIANGKGYEISLEVKSITGLRLIADLFLKKSRKLSSSNDEQGNSPWTNAWVVPIIYINYSKDIFPPRGFNDCILFRFNNKIGEYSFLINSAYTTLCKTLEGSYLKAYGFKALTCYANHDFIRYIDRQFLIHNN